MQMHALSLVRPHTLQALLARSLQQMPDFSPQGLANTAWAMARLGVAPGELWLAALLEHTSRKMPGMTAQVRACTHTYTHMQVH